ncbi:MAG: hypothetical protein E7472_02065 [Ruminococcaceae bacterium]|nr:hypothetical protein [Oscillospiraceae bacterium]
MGFGLFTHRSGCDQAAQAEHCNDEHCVAHGGGSAGCGGCVQRNILVLNVGHLFFGLAGEGNFLVLDEFNFLFGFICQRSFLFKNLYGFVGIVEIFVVDFVFVFDFFLGFFLALGDVFFNHRLFNYGFFNFGLFNYGFVSFGLVDYGLVNCGLVNFGLVNCGLVNFGLVNFGLVNYGLVNFGLVNCGLVNFGLVNYGLVNYGLVNFGLFNFGLFNFGLFNFGLVDFRLFNYGLFNYGFFNFGLFNFGLFNFGLFNCRLFNYGFFNYGFFNFGLFSARAAGTNIEGAAKLHAADIDRDVHTKTVFSKLNVADVDIKAALERVAKLRINRAVNMNIAVFAAVSALNSAVFGDVAFCGPEAAKPVGERSAERMAVAFCSRRGNAESCGHDQNEDNRKHLLELLHNLFSFSAITSAIGVLYDYNIYVRRYTAVTFRDKKQLNFDTKQPFVSLLL